MTAFARRSALVAAAVHALLLATVGLTGWPAWTAQDGAAVHLDAWFTRHHDVYVRTTLTIDDDLAAQLREEAARQGLPFRQVLNRMLRLGLRAASGAGPRERFRVEARRLGLRAGFDPAKLNQLADEFEDEEILRKHARA